MLELSDIEALPAGEEIYFVDRGYVSKHIFVGMSYHNQGTYLVLSTTSNRFGCGKWTLDHAEALEYAKSARVEDLVEDLRIANAEVARVKTLISTTRHIGVQTHDFTNNSISEMCKELLGDHRTHD